MSRIIGQYKSVLVKRFNKLGLDDKTLELVLQVVKNDTARIEMPQQAHDRICKNISFGPLVVLAGKKQWKVLPLASWEKVCKRK
jgi:hypothetical protein